MKKTNLFIATLVAASILQAGFASAALIPVINAGFEAPVLGDGQYQELLGWDLSEYVDGGAYNPPTAAYPAEAPEGNNVAWLWDEGASVYMSQTLLSVLTANTHYTLEVEVGDPLDYDGFGMTGFPGYRVELLAGGTVLSFDNNTLNITEGTFETSVVTFFAPSGHANLGDALEIKLINLAAPGAEVDFDNVRLTAIPEPSTLAMFGIGAGVMGLVSIRRRRREQKQAATG